MLCRLVLVLAVLVFISHYIYDDASAAQPGTQPTATHGHLQSTAISTAKLHQYHQLTPRSHVYRQRSQALQQYVKPGKMSETLAHT